MRTIQRRRTLTIALAFAILAGCSPAESPAGSSGSSSSQSPSQSPAVVTGSSSQPEASPSHEESGVTGTWDGSWQIDPPYSASAGDFTMELVQSGDSFTGPIEITNTDCPTGTVQGTLDGSNISLSWVLSRATVSFTGTLDGDSMSGTWSSIACSDPSIDLTGTWEATKQS
jgi:hypothetical protein